MGSLASWVALALGSAGVLCQDLVCPSTVFPSWPVSPKLDCGAGGLRVSGEEEELVMGFC